ncbi:chemotaxis protein CheA [Rhodobacterales bacterium HKCCE2091]|nr:chemotaxis protein CheA [Rhodobacterales bacterium HKCCE2091]
MSADNLKALFFVECEELLEALGEGLQSMESGDADSETLHSIFRAVHSIKGTAGAFGFNTLVTFTHHFETVLDLIRSDQMGVDAEAMRLLFRASDILSDLVELAREGDGGRPDAMDSVLESLIEISRNHGEEGAAAPAPPALEEVEAEPLAFEPLAFDPTSLEALAVDGALRYHLRFDPGPDFFRNGHDFDRLVLELEKMGTVTCAADPAAMPALDGFDPELCHLAWDIEIETEATEAEILDAFMFLEEFCKVTELTGDAGGGLPGLPPLPDPGPVAEEAAKPDPVPVAAAPADPAPGPAPDPAPAAKPARAAEEKAAPPAATGTVAPKQPMLRVDPERVDRLINTVGELIINQAVISQRIVEAGFDTNSDLMGDLDDFQHLAREIQEGVMAIRAQPVKPLFQRMQRIVRETVDQLGKDVQLVTEGENTEVDKTLVERLADPLTHMIRNAVDHGIEKPEIRSRAGKPERGTIRLTAAHRSGHVQIEIADDGAGVNRPRVFEKAVENGLIPADAKLTDSEIDNLLFMPGFSTAAEVTNLSGRGVGMDVVKTSISALGGRVAISSRPGKGTIFTISMPLTLAVMDGMVVHICGETMVVPLASIVETIRPKAKDVKSIGRDGRLLFIRGTYVPIVSLSAMLGLSRSGEEAEGGVFVLVRSEQDDLVALAVDDISDQRQVVIKSLEGNYGAIPGISAATILGDGRVALIIDTEAILSQVRRVGPDAGQQKETFYEQASALG